MMNNFESRSEGRIMDSEIKMVNDEDRMHHTLIDVFGLSEDGSLIDGNENNPSMEEYNELNTTNQEDMGCEIE